MNSVYIHIPFCSHICTYCAFTKYYYNEKIISKYLDALEKEIITRYKDEEIKTIYIGGGTPSSLNLNELKKLFQIIKRFKLTDDIEFTMEVNPENIDEEKLLFFKENKVNRISMGVESTISKYLNYLGRNHDFKMVKDKILLMKKIGFTNINVDLIYAIPTETLSELKYDLNNILSLNVSHISTYSLMIEPHTILGINKEKVIDEEIDYNMYKLICNTLRQNGYNHYEISNFCKEGYESRHNLVYWNNENYYGFGISAAGFINNIRYTNTTSLRDYLNELYRKEKEDLSKKDLISYELILGFRKIKGINKKKFYDKYHLNIVDLYNIKELIKQKDLIDDGVNIYINYDKIYIENSILINFIGE